MSQSTPRLQFQPAAARKARIYKDGACVGTVSSHNEHHAPLQRYYVILLDEDPRGFKYVRNISLLDEILEHWIRTRPTPSSPTP